MPEVMNTTTLTMAAPIDGWVPLPAVPRELRPLVEGVPPSYRAVWGLVVNGLLPAEQVNRQYKVKRSDLPLIPPLLGLRLKAQPTSIAAA